MSLDVDWCSDGDCERCAYCIDHDVAGYHEYTRRDTHDEDRAWILSQLTQPLVYVVVNSQRKPCVIMPRP